MTQKILDGDKGDYKVPVRPYGRNFEKSISLFELLGVVH